MRNVTRKYRESGQYLRGWKDLKTLMKYIRLAGIEVDNATQTLSFAPAEVSKSQVVNLFQGARQLPKLE
jgi:hypothetical protein